MKIAITGSTGLIGSALATLLSDDGHHVFRVMRRTPAPGSADIQWNPSTGEMDARGLEGVDAVVHLAGENIAAERWTEDRKSRLRTSRLDATRLLCQTLAELPNPPSVLVCASAIGYYGDRGDDVLSEESSPGEGFLPLLCREWEAACAPAREAGIRVANIRFGLVLSTAGGALAKMLLPFKLGFGGKVGSGGQYYSWIAIDDAVRAIAHVICTESLAGPVNVVAPNPVTNAVFTKTLGRALSRPTIFALPAFAVRLAFGEMGEEALLASTRVEPQRLIESGFEFRHRDLESALHKVLGD